MRNIRPFAMSRLHLPHEEEGAYWQPSKGFGEVGGAWGTGDAGQESVRATRRHTGLFGAISSPRLDVFEQLLSEQCVSCSWKVVKVN